MSVCWDLLSLTLAQLANNSIHHARTHPGDRLRLSAALHHEGEVLRWELPGDGDRGFDEANPNKGTGYGSNVFRAQEEHYGMSLRRTPERSECRWSCPQRKSRQCAPLREMVKWSRSPAMVVDDSADYCRWVCSEVAGMVPMELMASMQWTVLFDSSCDIEAISVCGKWPPACLR